MLPHDPDEHNPSGVPCPAPVPDGPQAAPALLFSRGCPRCSTLVSLPWCPIVASVLDQIAVLESQIEDLRIEASVSYSRLARLEALQGQAEGQP
jgi:hypothetical protein